MVEEIITKVANYLMLYGVIGFAFVMFLFAGMGVPALVLAIYNVVYWTWWIALFAGLFLHIVAWIKRLVARSKRRT